MRQIDLSESAAHRQTIAPDLMSSELHGWRLVSGLLLRLSGRGASWMSRSLAPTPGVQDDYLLAWQRVRTDPRHAWALVRAVLPGPLLCLLAAVLLSWCSAYSLGEPGASVASRLAHARQLQVVSSLVLTLLALSGGVLGARRALRRQQQAQVAATYRLATDDAHEGFFSLRMLAVSADSMPDFVVTDCNERGAAFVGCTRAELLGRRVSTIDAGTNVHLPLAGLWQAAGGGAQEQTFRVSPFGQLQPVWISRKVVTTGVMLAVTLRDITASKAHAQALARAAHADTLTKLPNRQWLLQALPAMLSRTDASGAMLALLVIDLDNFKDINDTLGHAAGDELLQAVAYRLRSAVRPTFPVVRLGGDEFTVVLEQIASADAAADIATMLGAALEAPFRLSGTSRHVRASIGVSMYPADGLDGEMLLKHADVALNAAKANGKAQSLFYQPQQSLLLLERLQSEAALRMAIEQDELLVYYQPRVNAMSGEICSMEALVRWQHPQRGLVPPVEFIPLAEASGLIIALGALVVEKTSRQMADWLAAGIPVVPVSINVSSRQFSGGHVQALFDDALVRHRLDPALIEIELTESCMQGEQQPVFQELRALQARGIKLLIDDFGTGYSSLSQLQSMNFDVLKVDMAFTTALGKSSEGEVFFRAIVWMAHALGMTVVAEGVETTAQLKILQDLACDEIQGYLVSRPVDGVRMRQLLQTRFLFDALDAKGSDGVGPGTLGASSSTSMLSRVMNPHTDSARDC